MYYNVHFLFSYVASKLIAAALLIAG